MSGSGFDAFFYGISQQESGGNYQAINSGTGALGKYQILPSNVPYWSQKYLGVNWTPQQFLGDPSKQEALAKAVLSDYYDKYGARGAAAAWYSGNPALANDYGSQPGGPSVGSYVDSVLAHAAGSPGSAAAQLAAQWSQTGPTTLTDNTVKDSAEPVIKPPKTTSGMESTADTTPGVGELVSPGTGAVDTSGVSAVGEGQNSAPGSTTSLQDQADPSYLTPATGSTDAPAPIAGTGSRSQALAAAEKYLGSPYVWGGGGAAGPTTSAIAHGNTNDVGFDCSGLVQYALAQVGVNVPRLSYDQLKMGQHTDLKALQPGDLVGFGDGGHIALYLGNNQIIEAPHTGAAVRVRTLGANEGAWGVSLNNLYK